MFDDQKGMAAIAIFAIVALLGVVVMFSGTNGLTGYATTCVQDRPDCAAGQFCNTTASKCVTGCRDSAPCPDGKFCINSKCVPPPTTCQDTDGLAQFVSGSAQLFKSGATKGNPKLDVCKQGKPGTATKPPTPAKLTEYTCSPPDVKGNQKIVANKITCPDFACNGNACHAPGTPAQFPQNATCTVDVECASGICNQNTHKCFQPAPLNARCARNEECLSKYCSPTKLVCAATNLSNNKLCFDNEQCAGGKCKLMGGLSPVCCTSFSDQELCQREGLACFDFSTSNTAILDFCKDIRKPNCGTCADGKYCYVARDFGGQPAGSSCETFTGCIQETSQQFCARHNSCTALSGTDNCGLIRNINCQSMPGCTSTGGTPAPAGCTPSRKCDGNSNTVLITEANCGQTRIYCLSHGSSCQNGVCVGGNVGCGPAAGGPGTIADPTRNDGVTYATSGGGSQTALDNCFNNDQSLRETTCVEGFLAAKGIKCDCRSARCLDAPQPGPAPAPN